ncbi:MAG: hypothetical protein IJO33_02035 [Bacilli bacterium]|nr:hypothetical protein [Bacilli bacterium]
MTIVDENGIEIDPTLLMQIKIIKFISTLSPNHQAEVESNFDIKQLNFNSKLCRSLWNKINS